jgi:ribosome-associated protein
MAKIGDPMTDEQPPSKTQKKQEMHDLQATGARLVHLSEERLRKFNLPDDLLQALLDAKRISAHGGLRRQLRYIGKLMRGVDMGRLLQDLDTMGATSAQQDRLLHAAEQWRERLLTETSALEELLRTHPTLDAQPLRTLLRNIKNEPTDRPSKYRRTLFRMLYALLESRAQDGSAPE